MDQQPVARWAWEDEGMTRLFQQVQGRTDTGFYPQAKMVWYAPVNQLDQAHRLAYQYKVYAADTAWAREVFFDAGTGALLGEHELIHHTDVLGKAKTKYSDTQSMVTDSIGSGQYRLREAGRGNGIETYDMNNGTNYNSSVDFTDADNFWNNVNAQKDEVASDAHWGAQMTFDYFKKEHNRNSYDNNNAKIYSFVHYSSNYNNAFWNGWCMTYGDGNGTTFTPLTAIDVCGHEIAHAVTSNTANLVYSYESGALNESFSDIFGNAVEQYGRPNDWSWRIGEDMTPSGNGIRAMENPNLFNQPKFYKGVKWYSGTGDNGGVHYNSGVQNYWFYLLSEGVTGTNEKGWSFSIDSLGMEEEGKIAYRNLSVYLTKSAQHSDARTYSIMAATDLYGNCSPEVISVTNAWWVCGVGSKYDSAYVKADFRSDTLVCRTGQSVQFANKSENFISLTWYFGDGSTSTALNPTHAYSSYGTYDVSLKAVACSGTDTDSIFMAGQVQVDSMADLCFGVFMPESGRDTASACFGFIYDDGADGTYNPNRNTALVLQIPGADSIRFRFLFCDYESGYDSLVLFKNNESWANKLGRLTGSNPALQGKAVGTWHQFAGHTLILKNYTDPAVEGAGFKIEFEGIRPALSVAFDPGADTLICYGDSLALKALGSGGWSPQYLHYWNG
ncbi:MAG: M4 family metallopeptidase, partial [Bacteroidia bacterium]